MDVNALRTWGIIASSAVIAVSIYLAVTTPAGEPPRGSAPVAVVQSAPPPSADAPIAISVRGDGPLARAQRLAMRGEASLAARRAQAALARQSAFAGLCFAGFTQRNEIALRPCAGGERRLLLARLRAMHAIAYVDADAQLTHDGAGD